MTIARNAFEAGCAFSRVQQLFVSRSRNRRQNPCASVRHVWFQDECACTAYCASQHIRPSSDRRWSKRSQSKKSKWYRYRRVRSAMLNRVRLKECTNGNFQSRPRHRFHGFTTGKKPSVCWRSNRRAHRCLVAHFSLAHLFKLRQGFASKRYRNRP